MAENQFEARSRISQLIRILAQAPSHGLGTGLRIPEEFYLLQLAENYTLNDWLSDPTVNRDERAFLLKLATNSPPFRDAPNLVENRIEITEVYCDDEECILFRAAYLLDVPIISLNHDKWSHPYIATKVQHFDEEGELNVTERDQVNLSQEEHFTNHQEWIEERRKRNIESMDVLWEKRGEVFPNLVFCDSVEDQLLSISSSSDSFALVTARLFDLERVSRINPFDINAFNSRCSPSSQTALTKFTKDYTFTSPDGRNVICGWHLYLPDGNRIYFAIENGCFTVGHVGEHLPTKDDPK